MQLVDQALLQRTRAGQRGLREETGVETETDRHHSRQNGNAKPATHPFADAKRPLHRLIHPAADQKRQRQRRRRTQSVGEQQQRRADARSLQRRPRQDQAENRAGAGRPEQPRGNPQQGRRRDGRSAASSTAIGRLRQPRPERYQRPRQIIRQGREKQDDAEDGEQHKRRIAAILVGLHRPAATERRQRRNGREGRRHADKHRQRAAQKRLAGAREDERQHRQDAGADDGQHAPEISENEEDHDRSR